MTTPIWLTGSLAEHRRARVLADAAGTTPAPGAELPSGHGLFLRFGTEFQQAAEDGQTAWADWSQEPGRALLLVPPLRAASSKVPCPWRVLPIPGGIVPAGSSALLAALAGETRQQLSGDLLALHPAGVWADGAVHTAYHRKHPHAGLFAVTTLPVWSVSALEHKGDLARWLAGIAELAGKPAPPAAPSPEKAPLSPGQVALLLHLCTARFPSERDALDALRGSPYFSLPSEQGEADLGELRSRGLVEGVGLTEQGRRVLRDSPFAVYYEALEGSQP
jgi:hypothetical protein